MYDILPLRPSSSNLKRSFNVIPVAEVEQVLIIATSAD